MSDFFVWNAATLGLDIPEMDREHQVLIGLMNTLHDLWGRQASRLELSKALAELVSYTTRHFTDEEAYMARVGYPDVRKHHLIHEKLLSELKGFAEEFRVSGQLGEGLFLFLKTWLKAHICGIDTKYAAFAPQDRAVRSG